MQVSKRFVSLMYQKRKIMTATKPTFAEIINIEGFKLIDAGEGKRFIEYPSGKIINNKHSRFMLFTAKKIYAGGSIDHVIIAAFKDGEVNLNKHGYDTCHRCNGTGKLAHYSHVNNGTCFKCNGYGVL